jgi:hypothetical protein
MALPDEPELFELSMHGGAPERRYRRLRPDVDRLPWDSFRPGRQSEATLAAARRGWTEAALQEYASADAHAVMLRALVRARAPLDLSAVVSRFPLDELAHAELCARMAGLLGGGAPVAYEPNKLYPSHKAGQRPAELEAAELVLWNCCVSESWAHQVLSGLWEAERDPLMRPLRGRIAKDEAAHGQFGWIFLDWLDPEPGDRALLAQAAAKAVRAVKANIEATIRRPEVDFGPLTPLGGLGKSGYIELANDAPQQRVLAPLAARSLAVE